VKSRKCLQLQLPPPISTNHFFISNYSCRLQLQTGIQSWWTLIYPVHELQPSTKMTAHQTESMIIGAQKRVAAQTSRNLRFLGMPILLIPQLSETIVATTNIMHIQNALTTTISVVRQYAQVSNTESVY
jgi:hypothetical protein